MSARAAVCGAAAWIAGQWIESGEQLSACTSGVALSATDLKLDLGSLGSSRRVQRADMTTRLGAMVASRALRGAQSVFVGERVSVLTASWMASAASNEAWELKRIEGARPDPRVFAYTATSAVAGEIATALGARGPSLALLGGAASSLAAVRFAVEWIDLGECDRAIVIAVENPPRAIGLMAAPHKNTPQCAAAIAIERMGAGAARTLSVNWSATQLLQRETGLLSVEPLAAIAAVMSCSGAHRVYAKAMAGAGLEAELQVAG